MTGNWSSNTRFCIEQYLFGSWRQSKGVEVDRFGITAERIVMELQLYVVLAAEQIKRSLEVLDEDNTHFGKSTSPRVRTNLVRRG